VDSNGDRPREACGVVGIVGADAAGPAIRRGLLALQHRGQEAAGLCVVEAGRPVRLAGAGLVRTVLPEATVQELRGDLGLGHVRYSTAGGRSADKAQPIEQVVRGSWFAIAHNGNLLGCAALARSAGLPADPDRTDSELVALLLAKELARDADRARFERSRRQRERFPIKAAAPMTDEPALCRALRATVPRLTGAFSFVLSDGRRLYGVRDPKGLRPLCLGRLDNGWVLASETPALDAMGATFAREVEPGEVVIIDGSDVRSEHPFDPGTVESRLCLFEFVYFSRPDGHLYGRRIDEAREAAGAALADFAPLPPDRHSPTRPALVVPIPSSADWAARGYARRSGLPFGRALVRNTEVGRSFLAPMQHEREQQVLDKLVPDRELVAGRRLVVIDDSLVRGTTARAVVDMLRRAGAAEVHLRIASPPWRWPCHFGIDAGDVAELAAGVGAMSEVLADIGCESLAYLPLDRVIGAVDIAAEKFCTGCMTGRYPIPVPTTACRGTADLFLSVAPHRLARTRSTFLEGVCA